MIEETENTEDIAMGRKSKVASASDKTSVTDVADISDISTDDLDEDEEVEEPKSLVDKIKAKFAGKKSSSPANKKVTAKAEVPKRKAIIYAAVLVLLVILFWDEIFPPDTVVDTTVDQSAVPALKAKGYTKKPKSAVTETTEVPSSAPNPSDVPVSEANTAASETTATPTPSDVTPTPEVTSTPEASSSSEESKEKIVSAPKVEDIAASETVETPSEESIPAEAAPKTEDTVSDIPKASESIDSIDGQVKTSSDENMTEKILEDLEKQAKAGSSEEVKTREYVSPPDYEYRGRGLVYNCIGKHWACVDAPSFKTCQNNAEGNKYLKKKVECYPVNVYQNQKGCEIIQNRMVSASTKTNFCN